MPNDSDRVEPGQVRVVLYYPMLPPGFFFFFFFVFFWVWGSP